MGDCYMRNWRCDLDEGPLLITRPMPLSPESISYVLEFLALFEKQLKRELDAGAAPSGSGGERNG